MGEDLSSMSFRLWSTSYCARVQIWHL